MVTYICPVRNIHGEKYSVGDFCDDNLVSLVHTLESLLTMSVGKQIGDRSGAGKKGLVFSFCKGLIRCMFMHDGGSAI